MANEIFKKYLEMRNIPQYKLAEILGVTPERLCGFLRKPLDDETEIDFQFIIEPFYKKGELNLERIEKVRSKILPHKCNRKLPNSDIRSYIQLKGVTQCSVADAMNIQPANLSKFLRKPLDDDTKFYIQRIVDGLAEGKVNHDYIAKVKMKYSPSKFDYDCPNSDIKSYIQQKGVMQYEVAAILGIPDTSLSKLLRKPLDEIKREKVYKAIDIAAEQKGEYSD